MQQANADVTENQRLLPIVDTLGLLAGVVTRGELEKKYKEARDAGQTLGLREFMRSEPIVADSDDPLRVVVNRMAEKAVTRMPVVQPGNGKFLGLVSLDDLLKARSRHLEEEQRREQTIWLPYFGPRRTAATKPESRTSAAEVTR